MVGDGAHSDGFTRRRFLADVAAVAGAATVGGIAGAPGESFAAAQAPPALTPPPGFPAGIALQQESYANWSLQITSPAVWTCVPNSAEDVVTLANWAVANGYRLRPRGAMHGWTPLTIVNGASVERVVLVDTTVNLNAIAVVEATVTAGAGATLENILAALEAAGLGWTSIPAPGDLTIAGALAVDAHGAATPAVGESPNPGTTYGSLSNLVLSLTAVVWNAASRAYELRTFTREDPAILPLLTHLGRAFVTSVTLQASANQRLRCESFVDIPWQELFAPAGAPGRTFESYLAQSGRVEAIWYPFTQKPWLKVWTPTPVKPLSSHAVTGPYNYTFSDGISVGVSDAIEQIQLGNTAVAPTLGQLMYDITAAGLPLTDSSDMWGWSKDVLLYILPTTLRLTEGGGAVITSRANVANVINAFTTWYQSRVAHYQTLGQFPINGPVEIRCCGLDQAADVAVASAGAPTISALRPRPDHPEWDTAVWCNVLGVPGTPGMWSFYTEIQEWLLTNFNGASGVFHPEWSKGWAFTPAGPYTDPAFIAGTLPAMYRSGVPASDNWDTALSTFDAMDPNRIFSNQFIDQLLP